MSKVPSSFLVFQSLLLESSLREVGNTNGSDVASVEASLSYLCDTVLSSIHSHEDMRDMIVDSRPNAATRSVLLTVNPEFPTELMGDVLKIVRECEGVEGVAVDSRADPRTKLNVTVLKVVGKGKDVVKSDKTPQLLGKSDTPSQ